MNAPFPPDDRQLLAGLRERDNQAFALLYTFYYPAVERFVLRNNGTAAHAQDIFQETILVLLNKVPATEFELTSSLKTYLLAISRNLWLKHLQRAGHLVRVELVELEHRLPAAEPAVFSAEAEDQPRQQVQGLLARISAKCQALIRALFFAGKPIATLAHERGYTSVHNAQNQKYKCLEQARRSARPRSIEK